jgi:hypothetical protein
MGLEVGGQECPPYTDHASTREFEYRDLAGFRHPHLENREMWGTRGFPALRTADPSLCSG